MDIGDWVAIGVSAGIGVLFLGWLGRLGWLLKHPDEGDEGMF